MKKTIFKRAGLNDNEAEVYRLLLDDGELAPPEIAERAGLSRQNSYAVLKSLEQKGLARIDKRHNKIKYLPESPERLVDICDQNIKKLEISKESLERSMDSLLSFYNLAKDRPGISIFKGIDGIQALYEDTIKRKPKEILLILSEEGKGSYLSTWIVRHYRPLRLKYKIALREIITTNEKHDPKELKSLLWEKKFAELPHLPRNIDILLYDDNVTFIKYDKKEPVGFTIDDSLVYAAMKSFFEMIWAS